MLILLCVFRGSHYWCPRGRRVRRCPAWATPKPACSRGPQHAAALDLRIRVVEIWVKSWLQFDIRFRVASVAIWCCRAGEDLARLYSNGVMRYFDKPGIGSPYRVLNSIPISFKKSNGNTPPAMMITSSFGMIFSTPIISRRTLSGMISNTLLGKKA